MRTREDAGMRACEIPGGANAQFPSRRRKNQQSAKRAGLSTGRAGGCGALRAAEVAPRRTEKKMLQHNLAVVRTQRAARSAPERPRKFSWGAMVGDRDDAGGLGDASAARRDRAPTAAQISAARSRAQQKNRPNRQLESSTDRRRAYDKTLVCGIAGILGKINDANRAALARMSALHVPSWTQCRGFLGQRTG